MGVVGRLDQYASMLATEFDDYSMSENLLTYSQQFNGGGWSVGAAGITPNTSATTAPDGTNTATKLYENNTNAQHVLVQLVLELQVQHLQQILQEMPE